MRTEILEQAHNLEREITTIQGTLAGHGNYLQINPACSLDTRQIRAIKMMINDYLNENLKKYQKELKAL